MSMCRCWIVILGAALWGCSSMPTVRLPAGSLMPVALSHSGAGAFEAALAVREPRLPGASRQVAVAWYDTRHGAGDIYLRLLDQDLSVAGPERRLTMGQAAAYEPDLAFAGETLLASWYEVNTNGASSIVVGGWDSSGAELWRGRLSDASVDYRNPVLKVIGERLLVTWVEDAQNRNAKDSRILGAWYHMNGLPLGEPFFIAAASPTTWNLKAAALLSGQVLLTWDAEFETQASELYLAVIDDRAVKSMRLSADDGQASTYPDVQPWYTTAIISWQDARHDAAEIYLAAVSLGLVQAGTPQDQFRATSMRVTRSRGEAIGAYLARNGQRLALAYSGAADGQYEIHLLTIHPEGDRLAFSPMIQLSDTATDLLIPALQPLGEGFVLAWNEADLGTVVAGSARSEVMVLQVAPEGVTGIPP